MKKPRFEIGDMVHVPYVPDGDETSRFVWPEIDNSTGVYVLNSTAIIVTMTRRGKQDFAYIMPSEGAMGWIKLGCCVRRLEDRGKQFKHEVQHVKLFKRMRDDWDGEDWVLGGLAMALLSVIVIALVVLVCTIRSSAHVDFCYTTYMRPAETIPGGSYVVRGHIPYRTDVVLGTAATSDEANELQKRVCPVKP